MVIYNKPMSANSMPRRTWAVHGPRVPGAQNRALVTNEVTVNPDGVGPDFVLHLTVDQLVTWLVAAGYKELETDVAELRQVWDAVPVQERWEAQHAADLAAWAVLDDQNTIERLKLMRSNRPTEGDR
jgi:hypothetical protein